MSLINRVVAKINYLREKEISYKSYLRFVAMGNQVGQLISDYIARNHIHSILFLEKNALTACVGSYFAEHGCKIGFSTKGEDIRCNYNYYSANAEDYSKFDVVVGTKSKQDEISFPDFCKIIEEQGLQERIENVFSSIRSRGGYVVNAYIPTKQDMPRSGLSADGITRKQYDAMQTDVDYKDFIENRNDIQKRKTPIFRGGGSRVCRLSVGDS